MNKKFSTLVASLLLSSAFSVYAGNAKPMLATPTQVETRATSADVEEAVEWTGSALTTPSAIQNYVLNGFTNNSRIAFVNGSLAGSYLAGIPNNQNFQVGSYASSPNDFKYFYWSFVGGQLINNAEQTFSIGADKDYFEVIPLTVNGEATSYFVLGQRGSDGSLKYLYYQTSPSAAFILNTNLADASVFCSVETAYSTVAKGDQVNDVLGGAFNLYISSLKDENATITNAEAFDGNLTAMKDGTQLATATENTYYIKNADGKFIVFDAKDETTSDGYSEKGKFKVVNFANVTDYDYYKFQIKFADNGSETVQVTVGAATQQYRLYIANVNNTYGLSVADLWSGRPIPAVNWAATSFDQGNIVDLRDFLTGQYYTVDFVKSIDNPTDPNDAYKKGGRLAIRENGATDYADFVDASGLYEKAPEAQWAVSSAKDGEDKPYFDGTITLTNRENPSVKLTIDKLRRTNDGFLVVSTNTVNAATNAGLDENDIVRITAVTNHDKHDGYEVVSDNDLRNETYYLGQVRQAEGEDINVYWSENHAASHQIGATVDEANAAKWNLSLVKKDIADHRNEIDSVLVISELQEWNDAKSRIDAKQDTLVIFPYAFQNRSNSEFVKFNNGINLNYYECDAENKNDGYKYGTDAIFALKLKADINGNRIYNYVMLDARDGADYKGKDNATVIPTTISSYATLKTYQENSTDRGTWKNMQMYGGDANALMFVTKVQAPEYRKLETSANLDTIKIYRADNEAQVVYEKRDAKSVVDGRTLSFLNIDNVEQFKGINPALYADTAYVNRGNNTRYQYLLGVNIEHTEGFYCPIHGFTEADDCGHAVPVSYNKGRYLINMIDTANVYGKTAGIHNNPYINETEEGRTLSKLSFVDAIHVLTDGVKPEQADKLYVINNGDTTEVALGTESLNTVKFAFKYIDSMESSDFKIQTLYKPYAPSVYGTSNYGKGDYAFTEEGYLRWVNGCLVVDSDYTKGDVFNMDENETRTPTANEEITAEGNVIVAGVNGAVVVKGAEGKNVIVSTILGKVVANEVVSSDNATIAAPAGVVVVSVDGESFKVVVK